MRIWRWWCDERGDARVCGNGFVRASILKFMSEVSMMPYLRLGQQKFCIVGHDTHNLFFLAALVSIVHMAGLNL